MSEYKLEDVKKVLEENNKALETQVKEVIRNGASEANEKLAKLETEIANNKKGIENLNEQIRLQAASHIPGFEKKEAARFSIGKALAAHIKTKLGHANPWKDAGYEAEVLKVATADDGSAGGLLVPTEVSNQIIDLAVAQMPIMSMGVTTLRGLKGDVELPKITSRQTSYWVGENEKPTASDVAFANVKLSPKEAAAYSKISTKLILQSSGAAESIIRQQLSLSLADKIHDGLVDGTGSDSQPLGIMNQSGMTTSTVGTAGVLSARFRTDHAANMQMDLDAANELTAGSFGYLMHPKVLWGMKRERVIQYSGGTEAAGQPVLAQNLLMSNAILEQQLGYMLRSTTHISTTEEIASVATYSNVLFGNWAYFYIGMWGDLNLKISDQAGDGSTGSAFLDRQVYVLVSQMIDCQLVRPTAFTKVTGCQANPASW